MDIEAILGFLNTFMGIIKKVLSAVGIDSLVEMFG